MGFADVVTTFSDSASRAGDICSEGTAESLQQVIQSPKDHGPRTGVDLFDGTTVESELRS